MTKENIILSIIVISHNQKSELKRCVESILAQNIAVTFELIISDDRSTDGTFELAQEYAQKYPHVIQATQCNSDDCNPANNSQRSGWNRCNGYKLASGKYIAHVDADDYFRDGSHVYQHQVELLERHPECSLCMQNVWIVTEGSDIADGRVWHTEHLFKSGRIITAQEFLIKDYFILNQAFVARRNALIDPIELYGKQYVDVIITYHHLQFGSIVCLDECDYIYVQHSNAITSSLTLNDQKVLWGLAFTVYPALLIPRFAGLYYAGHIQDLLHLVNTARHYLPLSDSTITNLKQYDYAFIYRVFVQRKVSLMDKVRLQVLLRYLVLLLRTHFLNTFSLKLLHILLVSNKIDKYARFNIH